MRQPRREEVLSRASAGAIGPADLRDILAPRRASQCLYQLWKRGALVRVGGDGTKESPYLYEAAVRVAQARPFDSTGLAWLTAA